jgi:drug/metabolite transporter (DMT)-like permease
MKSRGVLQAIAAAALFGLSTPAAKLLLGSFSPLMLSALLYLGATIALHLYRLDAREAPLSGADWPLIAGITFFGGILGPVMLLFGLRHLSAVAGSLLLNLEAPFTTLIAIGLLREHLGRREALAETEIMLGA